MTDMQITHTIHNLPAAVQQGIMIGLDGVIGGLGGVTLAGAPIGGSVTICLQGICDMQVLNSSVAYDDNEFIEVDANGRAQQFTAGTKVGYALEDGVAPVSGVYALKEVYLFGKKADPVLAATFAALDFDAVGAPVADVVTISGQVVDQNGDPIEEEVTLIATVYEATMIEALAAEFTLAVAALGGTELSTTDQSRLAFTTNADGTFAIEGTDVGSDREGEFPVTFEIVGRATVTPKYLLFVDFTD